MDVVELSPAYDTNGEISAIAAADVVYDFLSLLTLGVDAPASLPVAGGEREGQKVFDEL